jgi:hypothetical protein
VRCCLLHDPRRSSRSWGCFPGVRKASPLATIVCCKAAQDRAQSTILEDPEGRGSRGESVERSATPTASESASAIVMPARGACGGFTKRVGFTNMHHDCVAKRDLSWAWIGAKRLQVRCAMLFVARSTEVEQELGWVTRGSASLHPGLKASAASRRKAHAQATKRRLRRATRRKRSAFARPR